MSMKHSKANWGFLSNAFHTSQASCKRSSFANGEIREDGVILTFPLGWVVCLVLMTFCSLYLTLFTLERFRRFSNSCCAIQKERSRKKFVSSSFHFPWVFHSLPWLKPEVKILSLDCSQETIKLLVCFISWRWKWPRKIVIKIKVR